MCCHVLKLSCRTSKLSIARHRATLGCVSGDPAKSNSLFSALFVFKMLLYVPQLVTNIVLET